MTQQAKALSESLASAVKVAALAKANRDAANQALAHYVRSRMKSKRLTPTIVCHRLGWSIQKMSNFLNLNYVLDEKDASVLLDTIDIHRTRPEAARFSRSARIMEGKYKRAVQNLNNK
jgi:hypothetical protein